MGTALGQNATFCPVRFTKCSLKWSEQISSLCTFVSHTAFLSGSHGNLKEMQKLEGWSCGTREYNGHINLIKWRNLGNVLVKQQSLGPRLLSIEKSGEISILYPIPHLHYLRYHFCMYLPRICLSFVYCSHTQSTAFYFCS